MVSSSELIRYCFAAILVVVLGVFIGLTFCTIYNTPKESFANGSSGAETFLYDIEQVVDPSVQNPANPANPATVVPAAMSTQLSTVTDNNLTNANIVSSVPNPPMVFGNDLNLRGNETASLLSGLNASQSGVLVANNNPLLSTNTQNIPVNVSDGVVEEDTVENPSSCSSTTVATPPTTTVVTTETPSTTSSSSCSSSSSPPTPSPPTPSPSTSCSTQQQNQKQSCPKQSCPKPVYCPPCPKCPKPCPRMCPDMSKYVLKTSIPPCPEGKVDLNTYMLKSECNMPDMTKYVLKSSLPSYNQTPCPPCICNCGDGTTGTNGVNNANAYDTTNSQNAENTTEEEEEKAEENAENPLDNTTSTNAPAQGNTSLFGNANNGLLSSSSSSSSSPYSGLFGGGGSLFNGPSTEMNASNEAHSNYASSNITGSCGGNVLGEELE